MVQLLMTQTACDSIGYVTYSNRCVLTAQSTTKTEKFKHTKEPPSKLIPVKAFTKLTTKSDSIIEFYNSSQPYYEFTNFYPSSVIINKRVWPTIEHYFQAQKFVGTPYEQYIQQLSSPMEAFKFSRNPKVANWLRADWNEVKDDIMKHALLCKFEQNERLREKLLGTKKKKLIEHTFNDSYWGDGGDGSGLNKLGKLLMEVRDIMRSRYEKTTQMTFSSPTSKFRVSHTGSTSKHDKIKSRVLPHNRIPGQQSNLATRDPCSNSNPPQKSLSLPPAQPHSRPPSKYRNDSSQMRNILTGTK